MYTYISSGHYEFFMLIAHVLGATTTSCSYLHHSINVQVHMDNDEISLNRYRGVKCEIMCSLLCVCVCVLLQRYWNVVCILLLINSEIVKKGIDDGKGRTQNIRRGEKRTNVGKGHSTILLYLQNRGSNTEKKTFPSIIKAKEHFALPHYGGILCACCLHLLYLDVTKNIFYTPKNKKIKQR